MPEIFLGQVSKWLSQLKASTQRNYCFSAFLQTARSQRLSTAMQGRRTGLEQPSLCPRAPGAGCLELLAWPSGLCALVAAAFGDLSACAASPAHDISWPLPSTPAGLFFGNASGPYIELFVTARRLHGCPGMRSAYVSCNFSCQRSFV